MWCHETLLQMVLYTVITYSVHDGPPLSRRTLLPVFLFAPWECCPPLLLINCLSCSSSEGSGPPQCPPLRLTPFPSGSRHLPASSSATFTSFRHGQPYNSAVKNTCANVNLFCWCSSRLDGPLPWGKSWRSPRSDQPSKIYLPTPWEVELQFRQYFRSTSVYLKMLE